MDKQKTTIAQLKAYKSQQQISMLTCYDYLFSQLMEEAGIDCILVGDSVGTNVLGYKSEKEVTLEDMIHHTKAVARGNNFSLIIVDLPYKTYVTPNQALHSAQQLIQAGADAVKFEGYYPDIVTVLKNNNINVVCHLGLLPQTAVKKTVQALDADSIQTLYRQALDLEQLGADMMIVELIPEEVANVLTKKLSIPLIGIGAGRFCDGQVQIIYDVMGLTKKQFKHVNRFFALRDRLSETLVAYKKRVQQCNYLDITHSFHVDLLSK